ncbi:aromatic ring-hydroxylating oxygenase subunit alpha [Pseudonocardia acidicola]|uniref:Rieske 2Fe-2S domain-containing protein n=1 Tax=Pseudonocardia acidicola TaxID=2724939 RepID=A0ABX1SJ65_9PSEU|nr:SRPBCC family protein [Pseudonocardia acidicola]NMI00995.1 Rieske 2Fe-2S domain-containing protein [Pseudonocardia acidicola]
MTDLDDRPRVVPPTGPEVDHATRRWAERFPELGTEPISTDRFISPEFFERERELVFRRSWLNVGTVRDFPSDAGFFVRDIEVLGVSLLIVRSRDGRIQAYHNVCAHRGNKLIWEKDGPCPRMFSCRFHGWGYGANDGVLEFVPDEGQFYFPDRREWSLTPVTTDTWNGFIFVHMMKEPPQTLREYLGPLAERLDDFPFAKLSLQYRYDVPERNNWKIALDAQNEIYHVPMLAPLHRFLSGGAFHTNDEGYTRIADFQRLGLHSVYTSESDPDFEDTASGTAHAAAHPAFGELILPMDTPFSFHVVFPNLVIAFFNNSMFTYNIWPHAVDQTVWEIRLHYPEPANLGERVLVEQAKCRFRDLLCEDQAGHQALHVGLRSGARDDFVLGEQEVQIRAFHTTLDDVMQRGA